MTLQSTDIACILLAAGRSERFGADCKLARVWQGKPLGDHAADRLADFAFADHVAVVRPGGFAPAHSAFRTAMVKDVQGGLAHSIRTGIRAIVPRQPKAVLVALADMPLIPSAHFAALIAAGERRSIVATQGPMRAQVPALFGTEYLPALESLAGDKGAVELLVGAVALPLAHDLLRDFDRPGDFDGGG